MFSGRRMVDEKGGQGCAKPSHAQQKETKRHRIIKIIGGRDLSEMQRKVHCFDTRFLRSLQPVRVRFLIVNFL